ncbi:hypothetical protein ABE65_011660 [Fictibacillus phosphorivorans]|uniref:YunG n=1 Tax=Fictibacillus phosphorivorans TaxID=1221500 RepID=A0A160ISD1_9BACL|nr:hypothetical protein ABE65_011660 [Fictibacillus phosphorivorans]
MEKLQYALRESWSLKSSSKWSINNPANGQCGVTSLVVNDLLGGEIYKTHLPQGWHFYNVIQGKRYDFTVSQFPIKIVYEDRRTTREEALKDTNKSQYSYLKKRVYERLNIKDINK